MAWLQSFLQAVVATRVTWTPGIDGWVADGNGEPRKRPKPMQTVDFRRGPETLVGGSRVTGHPCGKQR